MFRPFLLRIGAVASANAFVLCCCIALVPYACAQSGTRSAGSRTPVAQPKPQGASPFLPAANREVRLPVSLGGFCVVTLREQQEWRPGVEANQLVFDGQLYWFAGQRQRAIFAATPQRYVPALAGNCVVTLAESGLRKRGNPQYGILHNERLFFFRSLAEQERFQAAPGQYSKLDLANEGRCLVSQIDENRQLPGLPETVVIVDGLRYQFAGIHQQHQFLTHMAHYGVVKPKLPQSKKRFRDGFNNQAKPLALDSLGNKSRSKKSTPPTPKLLTEISNKAMDGYCPVTIHEQGTWVLGDARYGLEYEGQTYLMASEAEKTRFAEEPGAYAPALGGQCVVSQRDKNRRVSGDIYHAAQYEGQLFLFAGAEQKKTFKANPTSYTDTDFVAEGITQQREATPATIEKKSGPLQTSDAGRTPSKDSAQGTSR